MDKTNLNSIIIEGIATYTGGDYDKVKIAGTGKITGDLSCNLFHTSGISNIYGNLNSKQFNVSGTAKIEGDVTAGDMEVSGKVKCLKSMEVDHVKVNGMMTVLGSLKGNQIKSNGSLTIENGMEAEDVDVSGLISCKGLLNCENLSIQLVGTSMIDEIGASVITVKKTGIDTEWVPKVLLPKKFQSFKLVSKEIEGDVISLENCEVDVVRGNQVTIGPNCVIGQVEYTGQITVDPTSHIGQQIFKGE